jgi:hypothetical protein
MARRRVSTESRIGTAKQELAEKLAYELKSERDCGQPFIYEQEYRTGKLQINVVWDEWHGIQLQKRSATISRAYELAEGADYVDRIVLASGWTVPEAHAAGMLPFEIIPAIRHGDPLTAAQAYIAMLEEGGTKLFNANRVHLRFATQEEAEASRQRLIRRFPGSDEVWIINGDITAQDFFEAQDSAEIEAQ